MTGELLPPGGVEEAPPPDPVGELSHAAPPARELGRLATALAAAAFVIVMLDAFLLVAMGAGVLLPGRVRLQVLLAQVLGIALPALATLVVLRSAGFRLPRLGRIAPDALAPLAASAVAGFIATWSAAAAWNVTLAAAGWGWVADARRRMLEAFAPLLEFDGPVEAIVAGATLALLPAVCEELAFRGCLQRLLRTRWSATASIGVTAFLFAALHLDPLGFPSRWMLGLALGFALERTRSLLAPALLHALHNGSAFVAASFAGEGADPTLELDPAVASIAVPFLVGIVILATAAWVVLLRLVPRAEAE